MSSTCEHSSTETATTDDLSRFCCQNTPCSDYGRRGGDNLRIAFRIYDPKDVLRGGVLRGYHLVDGSCEPFDPRWLPGVGLGLKLWEGEYEGVPDVWLRWCDRDGNVIPTGKERVDRDKQQADEAKKRAAAAEKRAEQLAEQLPALGVERPAADP